ncbi:MAG: RNA polymerase sigma factor [Anaerolineales bacterium]
MRFEEVIASYHDEIYRYLFRRCLSGDSPDPEAEAEDLTQDTFEQAFQAYDRLRPNSNVRAWLYKIARNRANDHYNKQQGPLGSTGPEILTTSGQRNPEAQHAKEQQRNWLLLQVRDLPEKQREALTMRYLQELSYADIAEVLSCSQDSARANVHQALSKLRLTNQGQEKAP